MTGCAIVWRMADTDCKLAPPMRHTRIIATVGPASSTPEMLDALLHAGVDIFRLNFSHGTHSSHRATIDAIRAAEARGSRAVAILQDLAGPKIRTGKLRGGGPVTLKDGETLSIDRGEFDGDSTRVSTTYADLPKGVHVGDTLLLDDGKIE